MKEFMLLYKGGNPDWMKDTPKEEMAAIMESWGAWMGMLQSQGKLASGGSPLNYSGKRLNKDGVVTDIAASEFKELISGYSIVKAEDYNEALELTKKCPIFQSPGVVVEVREVTEMA